MQMSKTYESRDRRVRAEIARRNAEECARAGYPGLAQLNRETAALLDPQDLED